MVHHSPDPLLRSAPSLEPSKGRLTRLFLRSRKPLRVQRITDIPPVDEDDSWSEMSSDGKDDDSSLRPTLSSKPSAESKRSGRRLKRLFSSRSDTELQHSEEEAALSSTSLERRRPALALHRMFSSQASLGDSRRRSLGRKISRILKRDDSKDGSGASTPDVREDMPAPSRKRFFGSVREMTSMWQEDKGNTMRDVIREQLLKARSKAMEDLTALERGEVYNARTLAWEEPPTESLMKARWRRREVRFVCRRSMCYVLLMCQAEEDRVETGIEENGGEKKG